MATTIGETGYSVIGRRRGWTQEDGNTTVITYGGPKAALDAFFDSLVGSTAIDAVELTNTEGTVEVEVTYVDDDGTGGSSGGSVEDLTVWELVPQDVNKPIRSYDADVGGVALNADANQAALELVRKDFEEGAANLASSYATSVEQVYAQCLHRGLTEYVRTAYILRSTLRVNSRSTAPLALAAVGVDKAWRIAGEAGSPDVSAIGSAAFVAHLVGGLPGVDASKKQWLKRAAGVSKQGRRSVITQEWWYAYAWSAQFYAGDGVP